MGELVMLGTLIAEIAVTTYMIVEAIAIIVAEILLAVATTVATIVVEVSSAIWTAIEFVGVNIAAGYEATAAWVSAQYTAYISPVITPITEFIGTFTGPLSDIVNALHLKELFMVHNLLAQVWDEYKALVAKLFSGMHSVLETIGLQLDNLVPYIEFTHSTMVLGGAMAGQPFAVSEMRYLSETAEWMKDVSADTERFRKDPYEIMAYVNDKVVQPLADKTAGNQTALYDRLLEAQENMDKIQQRTADVDKALGNWAESAPVEWRADIRSHVEPLREGLQYWKENEYAVFKHKLNGSISELKASRDQIRSDIDKPALLASSRIKPGRAGRAEELSEWDTVIGTSLAHAVGQMGKPKNA